MQKGLKKLLITSARGLIVFAIAMFISFHVRSDDLFTPDMPDAMERIGFPFLIWRQGGPVALDYFSAKAIWADLIIIIVATELTAFGWSRLRRARNSSPTLFAPVNDAPK